MTESTQSGSGRVPLPIHQPHWIAKHAASVVGALVIGAITQSVLLYAQLQVTNERLASMSAKVDKIEARTDTFQQGVGDRWTGTSQSAYAAKTTEEIKDGDAEVARLVRELRDDLDRAVRELRDDIRDHERAEGHSSTTAQIADLVRRMEQQERELGAMRTKTQKREGQ